MDLVSWATRDHREAWLWAITAVVHATARAPSMHSISAVLPCARWERSRKASAPKTWSSMFLIIWLPLVMREPPNERLQLTGLRPAWLQPRIETPESRIETLQPRIETPEPRIECLEPRFEWLKPRIEWLEPRIEWLEPRIECLEPRFECLEPRFECLYPRFGCLYPRFECLESRIECLEPRLEWLEPRMG